MSETSRNLRHIGCVLPLIRLFLAQERGGVSLLLSNMLMIPGTVCYLAITIYAADPVLQQTWLVGGVVVGLGMGCVTQAGYSVLADRLNGSLLLLRTTHVSILSYAIARLVFSILFGAGTLVIAVMLLALQGTIPLSIESTAAAAGIGMLGGAALGSAGLLLGGWAPSRAAGDTVLTLYGMVLAFVSPVFYDLSALPNWIQPLTWLSPYTHLVALIKNISAFQAALLIHLGCLLLFAIVNAAFLRMILKWK